MVKERGLNAINSVKNLPVLADDCGHLAAVDFIVNLPNRLAATIAGCRRGRTREDVPWKNFPCSLNSRYSFPLNR